MGDQSVDEAEADSLKRKVNRLWRMKWFKVGVSLLILIMLVGHMVVVYNAADSLDVESVRVMEILPGSIDGDFTVVFEITLLNPTSGTIEVERLTYDLFLESAFIGKGSKEHFSIGSGTTALDFSVTFNIFDLPQPVQEAFVQASATLDIEGEVTVPIKLLGFWTYTRITLPYDHQEEISSGTGDEPDLPPSAVVLTPPIYKPTASADLTWTRNVDLDFLRYEVHTSKDPMFVPTDDTRLVAIEDQNVMQYTASNLQHFSTHYFIVRVYDEGGQHADSNREPVIIP
jgi:LEA14-like dessication related protein